MNAVHEALRETLATELKCARAATDGLFSWLTGSAWLERPIAARHRLIFYLGHLEAFDWNLLARDAQRRPARNAAFEHLFAFGIDPLGSDLPTDTAADWPAREAIVAWIAEVRAEVDDIVRTAPLEDWLHDGWAIHLAIEHRLMHRETLAYLLAQLPTSHKRMPCAAPRPAAAEVTPRWCEIPAGHVTLGLDRGKHPTLGWDNEYDEHRVKVPAFRIASHKVTNAQWLEFLDAGGYHDESLWTAADATWRKAAQITAPISWRQRDGAWSFVGLAGEVPLPLEAPVYVSYAEACAYTRFRGASLPTEAQWQRAAYGTHEGHERAYPWGDAPPIPGLHGNFGCLHHDPTPIGSFPAGRSAFGLDEPLGNGWEWTKTRFAPFAGFRALPFYRGYSEPFFDGQHYVMKGASPQTPVTFLRRSFRNWFQPHYPQVFATVRLAEAS
jgi:gamma-glutamyl hercynylcysteine S-oxide synthase